MPKFEKVDANTIRIIVEKSNDVPLAQLLDNKKQLLEQKKVLETTLKNIDELEKRFNTLSSINLKIIGKYR